MRRMITFSCAAMLVASAASGCYIKKETVREPSTTTIERRSTVEVPETEVRTKTTVERNY